MTIWKGTLEELTVEVTAENDFRRKHRDDEVCKGRLAVHNSNREIFSQDIEIDFGTTYGADQGNIDEWVAIAREGVKSREAGTLSMVRKAG